MKIGEWEFVTTDLQQQQYREAKTRHPGAILLFRVGDNFELFNDDAQVAAAILKTIKELALWMSGPVPEALPVVKVRFPKHRLETSLGLLHKAGHRVAICEEVKGENP